MNPKKHVCLAKLDDGRIVEYDLCDESATMTRFLGVGLRLIGRGYVYSINGRVQSKTDERLYFYERTD